MGRLKQVSAVSKANLRPPYQKGQTGNPKGRPIGARQTLTEAFIRDLSAFYEKEGANLITRCAVENPALLIQVIARLLPKEITLEMSQSASLTDAQKQRIAEAWLIGQQTELLEADYVVESAEPVEPEPLPAEPALLPGREVEAVGEIRDGVDDFEKPRKQRRAGLDRV
jgi:hypothetical protein